MFEFVATRLIHINKVSADLIWIILNYYTEVLPHLPWLTLPHRLCNNPQLRRLLQDKYIYIIRELKIIGDKDYKKYVIICLAQEWWDLVEQVNNPPLYSYCIKNHKRTGIFGEILLNNKSTTQTCPWCLYSTRHQDNISRAFDNWRTDDEIYWDWVVAGRSPTTGVPTTDRKIQ